MSKSSDVPSIGALEEPGAPSRNGLLPSLSPTSLHTSPAASVPRETPVPGQVMIPGAENAQDRRTVGSTVAISVPAESEGRPRNRSRATTLSGRDGSMSSTAAAGPPADEHITDESEPEPRRIGVAFVLVALLVVGIACGGAVTTHLLAAQADERSTELAGLEAAGNANLLEATLSQSLSGQLTDLGLLSVALAAREDGILDRWDLVSNAFFVSFEGVLAVGAVRDMRHEQRAGWEANMSAYKGEEVTVRELDGTPAAERDRYIAVQHVTPPTPLLDYKDIGVLADRVIAVDEVLASGELRVTEPLTLLQGPQGYLAYTAVSGAQNATQAWGVLSYSLRIDLLIEQALYADHVFSRGRGLSLTVNDTTHDTSVLVYSTGDLEDRAFRVGAFDVPYAQRTLSFDVWTTKAFVQDFDSGSSDTIILAGAIITSLLALFVAIIAGMIGFMSGRSARRALAAAELAHTRVLSYVLHELRNPLHALSGFLALAKELVDMRGETAHASLKESVLSSVSQIYHMQAVLDDVLDIRALREGDFAVVPRPSSPASILRDTGFQFASLLGDSVRLTTDVDQSVPEMAHMDPTRVRQVIANALHNAYKATSSGTIMLGCCVVGEATIGDETGVWLAMAIVNSNNTGLPDGVSEWAQRHYTSAEKHLPETVVSSIGIWLRTLASNCSKITPISSDTPPVRHSGGSDDARHVRTVKSTNIGLTLCSRIAIQMGGRVLLDHDEENRLTRFVLAIPVEARPVSTSPLERSNASETSGAANRSPLSDDGQETKSERKSETHVLFVDDERVMRMLGDRMCRLAGARVTLCEDGVDVARALETDPSINVVLMDIVMHRSDGRVVCRELREAGVDIPIVAVTANVGPAHVAEYQSCGFNGMLGKPYGAADIARLFRHLKSSPGAWWINSGSGAARGKA